MAIFNLFYFVFIISVSISTTSPIDDIRNGQIVDKFEKFPHHVTINVTTLCGQKRYCSGSIITDQWVLTSRRCAYEGIEFILSFQRLFLNTSKESFSILLDNSSVFLYPLEQFDLALIKLPVKLIFSSTLKPVRIFIGSGFFNNEFAVMAGFTKASSQLRYGRYRVDPNQNCKKVYGRIFDEFYQLCTVGWKNYSDVPCEGNEGGGLIVGWPKNPILVGVFHQPLSCVSGVPAVYYKVSKFIGWIIKLSGYTE